MPTALSERGRFLESIEWSSRVQRPFGGVCELSLLFLFPACPAPVAGVAEPASCFTVPDGDDSDCVDGAVVVPCDGDWFVVCGVPDGVLELGAGAEPAGRVTTVPLRGGRYNAPFCPHAAVSASGKTAVKHNIRRFMDSPADGRAAPTIHE